MGARERKGLDREAHDAGSELLPVGLLLETVDIHRTRASVSSISAPGWSAMGQDGETWSWSQRRTQRWGAFFLVALVNAMTPRSDSVDAETDGDGWLAIAVRPRPDGPDGPEATVEVRGELDAGMQASVELALRNLSARVLRSWSPVGEDAPTDLPRTRFRRIKGPWNRGKS